MTLQHGSLISVYNRIRSQTGTTRFLAIDGSQSSFPASDWKSMTTSAPCPFDPSTCGLDTPAKFLTRTTSWDAFIIYAVDVKGYQDPYAPRIKREGYPDLPPNALPYQEGKIQGIYYNQAIVLQCLSTGIISVRPSPSSSLSILTWTFSAHLPPSKNHKRIHFHRRRFPRQLHPSTRPNFHPKRLHLSLRTTRRTSTYLPTRRFRDPTPRRRVRLDGPVPRL